ncbi:MAG: hypothetical protein CMF31_07540 [Kordiimonas sp.]|nr:hypothetical protein [Kordiimonas sp.]|tara:strand:- start:2278 stop:2610 length:333 start_codon:yes stop_codon:yes gene_type:complete
MAGKIKLNTLQNRTLALFQALALDPSTSTHDEVTGEVLLTFLPHAHGDHIHIGKYVVSAREASGFQNEKVWTALERKGLVRSGFPVSITLTPAGLTFETGLAESFTVSDH